MTWHAFCVRASRNNTTGNLFPVVLAPKRLPPTDTLTMPVSEHGRSIRGHGFLGLISYHLPPLPDQKRKVKNESQDLKDFHLSKQRHMSRKQHIARQLLAKCEPLESKYGADTEASLLMSLNRVQVNTSAGSTRAKPGTTEGAGNCAQKTGFQNKRRKT
jgi:hypothetical protein